jgi:Outer membrane efflux protein
MALGHADRAGPFRSYCVGLLLPAQLRSTDENVPQALAGWKPTVVVAGSTGYGNGISREFLAGAWQKAQTDRDIVTGQATVTQPLYTGGRVRANVNRATGPLKLSPSPLYIPQLSTRAFTAADT